MYKPSVKGAWKGRVDAQDGTAGWRWHQAVQLLDLSQQVPDVNQQQTAFAFLGFCCDEGVKRNQGRTGAAAGPAALRQAMASLAHHLPAEVLLYDAGDVLCTNQKLEEAQEQLAKKVAMLLQKGYKPLVLGGGHEVAYGHFLGLQYANLHQQVGILNFDAHFDLRQYDKQPSSGTPFLQIADSQRNSNNQFKYKVLGVQAHANTRALFQVADSLGVKYTQATEVQLANLTALKENLDEFLAEVAGVYLTIDLDVFAAGVAPGVSAVNALGLQPEIVIALVQHVARSGKLLSMDLAELNPTYDIDSRTAKLGAVLAYYAFHAWSEG